MGALRMVAHTTADDAGRRTAPDDGAPWRPAPAPDTPAATGAPTAGRRSTRTRWGTGALAAALGCLVLGLAVPRVVASVWRATRDPLMELINVQVPVLESELRGLIASRELALGWVDDDAGSHADIAAALLALSQMREAGSPAEAALLGRAADATAAGLALAPADPRAWLQLAYIETLRREGPGERAAAALQASLRTGSYDRADFTALRLRLCLLHWPLLDEDGRHRTVEQVRRLWDEAPDELVTLAADPDLAPVILAVLTPLPGARELLELLLLRGLGGGSPAV